MTNGRTDVWHLFTSIGNHSLVTDYNILQKTEDPARSAFARRRQYSFESISQPASGATEELRSKQWRRKQIEFWPQLPLWVQRFVVRKKKKKQLNRKSNFCPLFFRSPLYHGTNGRTRLRGTLVHSNTPVSPPQSAVLRLWLCPKSLITHCFLHHTVSLPLSSAVWMDRSNYYIPQCIVKTYLRQKVAHRAPGYVPSCSGT